MKQMSPEVMQSIEALRGNTHFERFLAHLRADMQDDMERHVEMSNERTAGGAAKLKGLLKDIDSTKERLRTFQAAE